MPNFVDRLDNYYAEDSSDTLYSWTSGDFDGWRNQNIENLSAATCYLPFMKDHSGPIYWYAKSANIDESQALKSLRLGFYNSLAWREYAANHMPWLQLLLLNSSSSPPPGDCGAYVAPGVWKEFDCYNLAAIGKTTNDDPFTPSWRLIGGYWQWGRKGPSSSQWYNTNTSNFAHGPTGSDAGGANDGAITGWDTTYAPDGSWSDASKTANDPCPAGYRVPTRTQWDGVNTNNTHRTVGSWSSSATNYGSARFFGNDLMLPAAGLRHGSSGSLYFRGSLGGYWSSSPGTSDSAWRLGFGSSGANTYDSSNRGYGFSVRCVAE